MPSAKNQTNIQDLNIKNMNKKFTDETLIDAIKHDDYGCYNQLFVNYYNNLCQYVYSILKNKNDAEDIVQELFLNIWNNRKKINIRENVSGYLYLSAKNMALNFIKSKANYQQHIEDLQQLTFSYEVDTRIEMEEFRIALFDCIDRLPEKSRKTFLLHCIQGKKQKDISIEQGVAIQTIKNQIWASLQKLKTCLRIKGIKK